VECGDLIAAFSARNENAATCLNADPEWGQVVQSSIFAEPPFNELDEGCGEN
jgi:hypothetical protein